jgi:hypothetical protein
MNAVLQIRSAPPTSRLSFDMCTMYNVDLLVVLNGVISIGSFILLACQQAME